MTTYHEKIALVISSLGYFLSDCLENPNNVSRPDISAMRRLEIAYDTLAEVMEALE